MRVFKLATFFVVAGLLFFGLGVWLVRGEAAAVPYSFTTSVNLSVSNSTASVVSSNTSYIYNLTNSTQSFTIPVTLNGTFPLFNVSLNETGCVVLLNESINNQTAYLEELIRGQLVPSQKQYRELELLRINDSIDCQREKNILQNLVIEAKYQVNVTETGWNASYSVLRERFVQERKDHKTTKILFWISLIGNALLLIYVVKGYNPIQALMDFINQRGFRPLSFGRRPPQKPNSEQARFDG